MIPGAALVDSVILPLGIFAVAVAVFLALWLARDRPGAVKGHPKQFFSGSRYTLSWTRKVVLGFGLQIAFMVTLFLFSVDFDRNGMATALFVLLSSILLVVVVSCLVGLALSFVAQNDLLLLIIAFAFGSQLAAMGIGTAVFERFVYASRAAAEGKHFVGVGASSDAGQFRDAGTVEFAPKTLIDTSRAVGYKSGSIYCIAPIVSEATPSATIQFWAVGMDCCAARGTFKCASQTEPLYGVVVQEIPVSFWEVDKWLHNDYTHFQRAAEMAKAEPDVSSNLNPVFVRLADPPGTYTTYDFACDSKWLSLTEVNAVSMETTQWPFWAPIRGEESFGVLGNWYNIVAVHNGVFRYLSTNSNGVMATTEVDTGSGFERWIILPGGAIKALKATAVGIYLSCSGQLGAEGGKGTWVVPGWKFGEEVSVGFGSSALAFLGSVDALEGFIWTSSFYCVLVLGLLGVIPQPLGRYRDPDNPFTD